MWLAPRKIKDNSLVLSNKTFVSYLPLSSPIFFYVLITSTPAFVLYLLIYSPISLYLLIMNYKLSIIN